MFVFYSFFLTENRELTAESYVKVTRNHNGRYHTL